MKKFFGILILTGFLVGFVKPAEVNLIELPKAERWVTGDKNSKLKKIKTARDPLVLLGLSQALGDSSGCIKYAKQIPAKSLIKDRAVLIQLECAKQGVVSALGDKNKRSSQQTIMLLKEAIASASRNINEWRYLPTEKKLSQTLIDSQFLICQWFDSRSQWKELRAELQKVFKIEDSLSRIQKAQIYFYAGNLLVAERQWANAFLQYKRAQELNTTAEVDSKLRAIMPVLTNTMRQQIDAQPVSSKSDLEPQVPLAPSADEMEQFNQAQNYLARNDTTGALASLAKLIKTFPMGVKSKWAQDKIFEIFLGEIEKSHGPNGESINKKRIENILLDFDAERQMDWGKTLFDLQYYSIAAPVLKKAAEQSSGPTRAAKAYFMAARAFQLSQNFSEAKTIYRLLIKNYPAAQEIIEAAIQWALIDYNLNDPSEAISHLEMARARKISSQQDLISLFWLFQSYKMKKAETEMIQAANDLIRKFPLTFYGLLASQEINKSLKPYEKAKPQKAKVNFSERETMALERARILLQAGLLDGAYEELSVFSDRNLTSDEGEYLAGFYGQALHYQKTFSLLNAGIENQPEKQNDFVIKQIFPKEYWDYVSDDGRRSDLDPLLLLSVMKQESAFDYEAVSRSGAAGLMQMILPTAEEVKIELNSKAEIPQDLFDPGTNIKFCAHYLANMIKKFNGSVPLALAAYNAGPKRITMFMNARGTLTDTWVDELPWSEPSFYVKSILKNYLVYRMLYSGLTQVPTPPWASSPSSSGQ